MNNNVIIDPLNLTLSSRQLLQNFLSRQHKDGYLIQHGETYWQDSQPISFTSDILVRQKIPGIWRYDVIDPVECGSGKLGSAHYIVAVLKQSRNQDDNSQLVVSLKQKRVVKQQKNAAVTEYDLMNRCHHLQVRGLFPGMPSLISMKRMPGILLNEALSHEQRTQPFTHAQRYKISIALLRALQKQMHQHMVCHQDINPFNIFYNPVTGEISIFDLGNSRLVGDASDKRSRGNAIYSAPEDFISIWTGRPVMLDEFQTNIGLESRATIKSDIYSIAKVLCLVWRDSDPLFYKHNDEASHRQLMANRIKNRWEGRFKLFTGMRNLSQLERNNIESQLRLMCAFHPEDRPDLPSSIDYFEKLYLKYKLSKLPQPVHSVVRDSHQLAIDLRNKTDQLEIMRDLVVRIKHVANELQINSNQSLAQFIACLKKKYNQHYNVLANEITDTLQKCRIHDDLLLGEFTGYLEHNSTAIALSELITQSVQGLCDHPAAIAEYTETLGLACLNNISSREELLEVIPSLMTTFTSNFNRLVQAHEGMAAVGKDLIAAELERLMLQIQAGPMNLDAIKHSSDHIERKLFKINHIVQNERDHVTRSSFTV